MSYIQTCLDYFDNNKIVVILLIVLISYLLYAKVFEGSKKVQESFIQGNAEVQESFIQGNEFVGEKKGYVFKTGDSGLGYYIDN